MSKARVIMIAGSGTEAGKDTVGDMIEELIKRFEFGSHAGDVITRMAFATDMKLLMAATLGIEYDTDAEVLEVMDGFKMDGKGVIYFRDEVMQRRDLPGRQFIINLAEGAKDLFGEDFWARIVKDQIPQAPHWTVITDHRFDVEARTVKQLEGVFTIKVIREGAGQNSSEGQLDDAYVDAFIRNDGTLEDLHAKVAKLFRDEILPVMTRLT